MDKSIAILTTFQDLPRSYGLVPVVLNQLNMLRDNGWEVGFFVQNGFQNHVDSGDVPDGIDLMPYVPFMHLFDYNCGTGEEHHKVKAQGELRDGKPITNLKRQVKLVEDSLEEWLPEYPFVITHDIMFQTWFIPHNQAIRNIGERHPEIKWLHWLHSGPCVRPVNPGYPDILRHSGMPHSLFISPNETMIPKFAEMYDIPTRLVKPVYHTINLAEERQLHPLVVKMIKDFDLLNADGIVAWPTRIDHPEGKGMFHAIRLVGMMNKFANIKFIFINSWSGNERARTNIERLKKEAKEWGIPDKNIIFTSEMGKQWENGVPHEVVTNILDISEMLVMPSQTETFSYAVLESALAKNMLILNEDLGVFKELAEDRADYVPCGFEWGGDKLTRHYWGPGGESEPEDPRSFWEERAHHLLARLGYVDYHCEHCGKPLGKIGAYNPLRQFRHSIKTFNNDWVYKNQLEPLLGGDWDK